DHDSLGAYPESLLLGKEYDIEVITGIELSCEVGGIDVHILGYFIDTENLALQQKLKELKEARFIRAQKIVQNLNRQGIDLRFESVLKIAGEGAIGRPHIATAMLSEELIYSFKEAFEKYIGYESAAYVEKLRLTPKEVFTIILDAGGIPVLAHPGITQVDDYIPQFIFEGLVGIESYHSEHSSVTKRFYQDLGRRHELLITGGSDFHSQTQTRAEIGLPKVPYALVRKMKAKIEALQDKRHTI
ncbi:MAG: hypothetical protein JW795_00165, partial [Chitinivibrionales bacterium]|nr:hypothetical protein [Chitinivibrionales bacterium]